MTTPNVTGQPVAASAGEVVIGLEVHAQVLTASKMFCSCSANYVHASANSNTCPVCSGMPGALPVINARALAETARTALALGCEVARSTKFDRKNYSYPDLAKGYQITQYDQPIGMGGSLTYELDGRTFTCGIVRVHLEEDTGKTVHIRLAGRDVSLVDYNRCGVPLMEIVTAPDIRSPEAAREVYAGLRRLLMYLGVNDGNLQEGSMRADVNVSLRLHDGSFGTKVEIKNLNSFRAVQRALEYEIERQRAILDNGGTIEQETRGWSEKDEITVGQRSKEFAHDYRYFPEPDLPPVILTEEMIDTLASTLPELPRERAQRLAAQYTLTPETARVLTEDQSLADYYEHVLEAERLDPLLAAHWVTGDVLRLLNQQHIGVDAFSVTPRRLAELLLLVADGRISTSAAKTVLEQMLTSEESAQSAVSRLDLAQISDPGEIGRLVEEVIASNARMVSQYRSGKGNVIQALLGQVRKVSGGKANPRMAREILEERLGPSRS
jgi:aspartyl-tRNA(Asn)/glutamyl-tRNA(Gln) amidotransferase subunit B